MVSSFSAMRSCWLSHRTHKIVPEITHVSSGTLNPMLLYYTWCWWWWWWW